MDRKSARRWLIGGRVQGVGFRFFVQHKAAELGLTGWARNLADGRVEIYASGTSEKLDQLAAALHQGPRMADVRSFEQHDEAVQSLPAFSIR